MLPYLVVFIVAAGVTALATPPVGWLARRAGTLDLPEEERKIHAGPVPSMGGIAMLLGLMAALAAASRLDAFGRVFGETTEPDGVLAGALLIGLMGVADDHWGLPAPVKLAGQIVAALVVVLSGIQFIYAWIPGVGVLALSPDLGIPLTVLVIVIMVNAVNLIDGLDGLAAGIVAIAAIAFFAFAYGSEASGIAGDAPTSAPLVAAALAGVSLSFLAFNFYPARIFMGDTGSMVLGLLLAASGVAFVGRTTDPAYTDFYATVPLLIPVLVLAVPFADTLFAIVRRLYRRQPLMRPDRGHLHHRLLEIGHSHRRAVLTLYFWSALVAFGTVGMSLLPVPLVVTIVAVAGVIGVVVTALGGRDDTPVDVPGPPPSLTAALPAEVAPRRAAPPG